MAVIDELTVLPESKYEIRYSQAGGRSHKPYDSARSAVAAMHEKMYSHDVSWCAVVKLLDDGRTIELDRLTRVRPGRNRKKVQE